MDKEQMFFVKVAKYAVIGVVSLTLFLGSFSTVSTGSRGVVTRFGSAQESIREPGFTFKVPFIDKMNEVYVSTQKLVSNCGAASKDLQTVTAQIALNYHVDPSNVLPVFRDLGNDVEGRIIDPALHEAVKAVTANFTAEELIKKRAIVREEIVTNLTEKLARHSVIIDEFSIMDFSFSGKFNEAIEDKTTAEQQKLKSETDLLRIRVEAEQKIATARAEAESLRIQRQEVTPELIQLRAIEAQQEAIKKWNGVLPTTTASGALPFINIK